MMLYKEIQCTSFFGESTFTKENDVYQEKRRLQGKRRFFTLLASFNWTKGSPRNSFSPSIFASSLPFRLYDLATLVLPKTVLPLSIQLTTVTSGHDRTVSLLPLPEATTGQFWSLLSLPVTGRFWSKLPLPVAKTGRFWSKLLLPVAKTGRFWSKLLLSVAMTGRFWSLLPLHVAMTGRI